MLHGGGARKAEEFLAALRASQERSRSAWGRAAGLMLDEGLLGPRLPG